MKMKLTILIFLIGFVMACRKEVRTTNEILYSTEDISLLDTLKLKLNQGEKWLVNEETHVGISSK